MKEHNLEERKVIALEKIASWIPFLVGVVMFGVAVNTGINLAS